MAFALDPITAGLELARSAVKALWPDKSEQERGELAAAVAAVQGQLAVNQAEASSSSTFVAGWRPFIGWMCGAALGFEYLARPILQFGFAAAGHALPELPTLDGKLWELLTAILGLSGLRSIEKTVGVK